MTSMSLRGTLNYFMQKTTTTAYSNRIQRRHSFSTTGETATRVSLISCRIITNIWVLTTFNRSLLGKDYIGSRIRSHAKSEFGTNRHQIRRCRSIQKVLFSLSLQSCHQRRPKEMNCENVNKNPNFFAYPSKPVGHVGIGRVVVQLVIVDCRPKAAI
jgi:hypothetical protein